MEEASAAADVSVSSKNVKQINGNISDDFKLNKESRAVEAMRVKDDQIRLLTEQNNALLKSLDKLEDEFSAVQMEHKAMENENNTMASEFKDLQSRLLGYESMSKRFSNDNNEKDKAMQVLSQQNAELLRTLESQESFQQDLHTAMKKSLMDYDDLNSKYNSLLSNMKQSDENANNTNKENMLKGEEIRLLKIELNQLLAINNEMKMKVEVEIENLQEQLRVRKEKQYQLLEKVNVYEEAKRQAEDKVYNLEDSIRSLTMKNNELEGILSNENKMKLHLDENYKSLQNDNNMLFINCKELQTKIEKLEKENIKFEADNRDGSDQLREMAEKVFQLLERLKLTELSKSKAMEGLKKKENEVLVLQKQNTKLITESTDFAKLKDKFETEKKDVTEQLKALRKHNQTLVQKSKDEASERLSIMEQNEAVKESLKVTEARLSFLLNKVQADEDLRLLQLDDRKKLESQVMKLNNQSEDYQRRMNELQDANRAIGQLLKTKADELNILTLKYEDVIKELNQRDADDAAGVESLDTSSMTLLGGARPGAPDDIDNVRLNEGRGRFYLEAKTTGAGAILVLKGRKPVYTEWLDKHKINEFLRKAQKTTRFREMMIEKLAMIFGLFMVEEEEKLKLLVDIASKDIHIDQCIKSIEILQSGLAVEEEAKRRMLLRYVHVTKDNALLKTSADQLAAQMSGNGNGVKINNNGCGVLQLLDSNITDEEMHALSALLRNDVTIEELHLRNNNITDDGARALGAVLANRTSLRLIDIRGNKIGKPGVRILAEALERSERVSHVYVHIGGKIEALGKTTNNATAEGKTSSDGSIDESTSGGATTSDSGAIAKATPMIGTVCIVDVRDNNPNDIDSLYSKLQALDSVNFSKILSPSSPSHHGTSNNNGNFLQPQQLNSLNAAMTNMPFFNNNNNNNNGNNNNQLNSSIGSNNSSTFQPSILLNATGIPSSGTISGGSNYNKTQKSGSSGGAARMGKNKKNLKLITTGGVSNNSGVNVAGSQSLPSSSSSTSGHGENAQTKMIENMKLALRENLWQGRSGGLDVAVTSGGNTASTSAISSTRTNNNNNNNNNNGSNNNSRSSKSSSSSVNNNNTTSTSSSFSAATSAILPPLSNNNVGNNSSYHSDDDMNSSNSMSRIQSAPVPMIGATMPIFPMNNNNNNNSGNSMGVPLYS